MKENKLKCPFAILMRQLLIIYVAYYFITQPTDYYKHHRNISIVKEGMNKVARTCGEGYFVSWLVMKTSDLKDEFMQPDFAKKLQKSIDKIDEITAELDNAEMTCGDGDLIIEEIKINAAIAKHSYKMGIARIETQSTKIADIPYERRKILAKELEKIIPEYREIWLRRNREGGLKDSTADFDNLLKIYKINK